MAEELIGKTIGGYDILRLIGQGGMASVYLARQKSMNREVALKVLPRQFLNDPTYLHRFNQEVAIVSKLEHRNIVPVYDYGEHEGQPYIVMRYLPGGSVDTLIRRGPLPHDRILDIIAQIAPALDFAHSKNILHRDLKPSNVLLDDEGGAFITDFGIARILGEQGPGITTQGVVGTPSYMSPEQAQAQPLDGRSDVYSLGVMLFEMATGRRPFESDTPYSIAVLQVTQPPPSPRSINPALSAAMESVIFKALKKRPDERYPNAVALAEDLKLAIERPHILHDTEPKLRRPEPVAPQAAPAHQPQLMMQPPVPQNYVPPSSSNLMPSVAQKRLRRRRGGGAWLSMMIGGLLGCALLAAVVVITVVVISALSNDGPAAPISATPPQSEETENAGTAATIATLDPTSEAARQTLVARNQQSANAPTPAPLATLPVGIRDTTPDLSAALVGVSGRIVFFDERPNAARISPENNFEIVWLSLETWRETQLTDDLSTNSYPAPSPDGAWIAFQSNRDGDFEIYLVNTVGGQLRKLTDNTHTDRLPWWSPDGQWIIYSSDVRGDGMYDLYRMRPDGSDNQVVFSNGQRNSHARYSPDGRYVVFTTGANPNNAATWEIGLLNLDDGAFQQLTRNDVRDSGPAFHPDGNSIIFVTFNNGDLDIATMDLNGENRQLLTTHDGWDWSANYSPNGQYIVFTSTINQTDQLFLMTADGANIQQITTTGGAYASWIP